MSTKPLPPDIAAMLPVEQIVDEQQRARNEARLRAALTVVTIFAVMGWLAFFVAVMIGGAS